MSGRKSEFVVHDLFIQRWSSRAMSGEPIEHGQLMSLFEAAKWAPSSFNNQPWRFVYAHKGTHNWEQFFALLDSFNQSWSKNASVFVIVLSLKTFEKTGMLSKTHSYDTGAACQNMALQGFIEGLVVHAIEGFDYEKARQVLNLSDCYAIEVMFAIGKPGNIEDLPELMQEKERLSMRKSIKEFVFEGEFPR